MFCMAASSTGKKDNDVHSGRSSVRQRKQLGHRFGLHNFRSSLAPYLIGEGLDPKTVQGLLRHANVGMTLSAYAQTIPEKVREAQEKFSEAMEAITETTAETIGSGTSTDTQASETTQSFQ